MELHSLMVTNIEVLEEGIEQLLQATLNTGKKVDIGTEHALLLEPAVGDIAAIELWHGLTALFTRAAWYRLVAMAGEQDGVVSVKSGGCVFKLVV